MYGIPGPRESKTTVIIQLIMILILFPVCIGLAVKSCERPKEELTKKRFYIIESIPCYDSVGNVYIHQQTYDHIPTQKDSIDFENEGLRIKKN